MGSVLDLAASVPQTVKTTGPRLFKALREMVALPVPETVGAPAPEMVGQLVATDDERATPHVIVCERAQLSDELPAPVDVYNAAAIRRHAIGSELIADDELRKESPKAAELLSAERREELATERKALKSRASYYRADVPARVLMAYSSADESAAA